MSDDFDFIDDSTEEPSEDSGKKSKKKKKKSPEEIEREAHEILDNVSSGVVNSVKDRVAYILNRFSDARNSDVELVWTYWQIFEPEKFNGHYITKDDLYALTKDRSLIRWRAKIQNEFRLFQADDKIKKLRGTLEEDARKEALEVKPEGLPYSAVYIDETGKTQAFLCVGSLWVPDGGGDVLTVRNEIDEWRRQNGINYEFHFSNLSKAKLPFYKQFFIKFLSLHPTAGFKIIVLRNLGLGSLSQPIVDLTFHLLDRGVRHEHSSGRAMLPRLLQVWMDEDEVGRDTLKVANIKERLNAQHIGGLFVDNIHTINSASNYYIQAVDLFTGAVNRALHKEATINQKDELAEFILKSTRMSVDEIDRDNTNADDAKVFDLSVFDFDE